MKKQVTVRMPKVVIERIAAIAKLAGVSPTVAYNVILASYVVSYQPAAESEEK